VATRLQPRPRVPNRFVPKPLQGVRTEARPPPEPCVAGGAGNDYGGDVANGFRK
jgi:hypothetical protein